MNKDITKCELTDHAIQWAGDGYFCYKCALQFQPIHQAPEKPVEEDITPEDLEKMGLPHTAKALRAVSKMADKEALQPPVEPQEESWEERFDERFVVTDKSKLAYDLTYVVSRFVKPFIRDLLANQRTRLKEEIGKMKKS